MKPVDELEESPQLLSSSERAFSSSLLALGGISGASYNISQYGFVRNDGLATYRSCSWGSQDLWIDGLARTLCQECARSHDFLLEFESEVHFGG